MKVTHFLEELLNIKVGERFATVHKGNAFRILLIDYQLSLKAVRV